jgi:predicted short-subunit dehydrogenase-like oxidoreductase (DUF2520 family)
VSEPVGEPPRRRLAFLGAGRVGLSLAAWSRAAGDQLVVVASRSPGAREQAARLLAPGRLATPETLTSADADVLLIAASDPALGPLAVALAADLAQRPQAPVVLHTAGALDASVLAPLAAAGVATGSLHPLKAFPRPLLDAAAGHGVVFGIDGDPAAQLVARQLALSWGGAAVVVPAGQRLLYHFGATLAAGGVVTLLTVAADLVSRLGLPPDVVRGYLELARGAIAEATAARQPSAAITGPLARGDAPLVRRQLAALAAVAGDREQLVLSLAIATLEALLATPTGPPPEPPALAPVSAPTPDHDRLRAAQQSLAIELAARLRSREVP